MGQYRLVVDNVRLDYEGALDFNSFARTLGTYFYDKGYDKKVLKDFQLDGPKGKHLELQLNPWKKITDYIRLEWVIRIIVDDLVKKEITVNGRRRTVDHAKFLMTMNGFIETDYDMHFEFKPLFVFMRTLYDKYVFPMYSRRWEQILNDHANEIYSLTQKHLNLYRAQAPRFTYPTQMLQETPQMMQ